MLDPGKKIGVLGGGQLGRMTGQSARELGYGFAVFEPSANCPAGQVADLEINASYEDTESLAKLAAFADVITYEFENVDVAALHELEKSAPVYPNPNVLRICQNREREKNFLKENGFPHAPYAVVENEAALAGAIETIGTPSVLKTASFGYDGKGQQKITSPDCDTAAIWKSFGGSRAVLEGWINYALEISVIVAKSSNGEVQVFPAAENIHTNHILDFSIVPARIDQDLARRAEALACAIADSLDIVGLLGVELFVLASGEIVINELAPRPHNSGHYTMDGCVTSQFEQFTRAVCGLPLGSAQLQRPIVMVNILGDAWAGGEPNWKEILKHPDAKLHLYGKNAPKSGRKMGHFTVAADTVEQALADARTLKEALQS